MRGRDGHARNKALVFSPAGELLAFYAKMQPFTPGGEPEYYQAGLQPRGLPLGRVDGFAVHLLRSEVPGDLS